MQRTSQDKREILFRTILRISTYEECEAFFRDLCTEHELRIMSERLEVLNLLRAGKTYRDIAQELGVSTATVTRVAHALNHGHGGYRKLIESPQETTRVPAATH